MCLRPQRMDRHTRWEQRRRERLSEAGQKVVAANVKPASFEERQRQREAYEASIQAERAAIQNSVSAAAAEVRKKDERWAEAADPSVRERAQQTTDRRS